MTGRFITLEGGEGAGKSTQIARLADALRAAGIETVTTREPGGSPGAEQIRDLLVTGDPGRWTPMTEALLHFAARADHVTRLIRPALDRDAWVICDRFADSTMAYQGYGQGLGRDAIEALWSDTLGDFRPDLTLILDIEPDTGLARAAERRGHETRYEEMDVSFHRTLRDGFLDIARREPDRCAVIDASGSIDDIAEKIFEIVRDRLGITGA